jgi:hypothetical protein
MRWKYQQLAVLRKRRIYQDDDGEFTGEFTPEIEITSENGFLLLSEESGTYLFTTESDLEILSENGLNVIRERDFTNYIIKE